MAEYIERNEFLELQIKRCNNFPPLTGTCAMDNVTLESEIMKFPVADVEPVRRGEWKGYVMSAYHGCDELGDPIYRDVNVWHCSKCDRKTVVKENYCPNCGAKMGGKENG